MTRPLRIEYSGAIYHVMNRGTNRCPIFIDEQEDRNLFKKTLAHSVYLYKIKIHAFSLMGNHYHLLLETPNPNLNKAMRHIDGVYTQRFNKKHGRDGSLFRGRYKSILVQKEDYFLHLVSYIHLNGTKAMKFPNPTADTWASHRGYLFQDEKPWWLTSQTVLSYFKEYSSPQKALDEFVLKGIPKEIEDKLNRKRWPAILGQKSFIKNIRKKFLSKEPDNRHQPQKREILKQTPWTDLEIKKVVDSHFRSGEAALSGRMAREYKWITIFLLRNIGQLTFDEIGRKMGGLSYSAVIRFLQRNNFKESPLVTPLGVN